MGNEAANIKITDIHYSTQLVEITDINSSRCVVGLLRVYLILCDILRINIKEQPSMAEGLMCYWGGEGEVTMVLPRLGCLVKLIAFSLN